MTNLTFTTRETYLAYRANWREMYLSISRDIRDLKHEIRNSETQLQMSAAQQRLHYKRQEANRMNLELAEAKKLAATQWANARLAA